MNQRHPATEAKRNDILDDIETVKEALAQPEQEPVAEGWCDGCNPDNCQGCGPAAKPKREPIFWYRPVGEDGGYEGPIHNGAIEKVRKLSGVWKPLYTTQPQRKPMTDKKKYRLLEHGEKIEKGDTVLGDDTVTWHPLAGWEVGLQWGGHFMMPMRRAIEAAHGIKAHTTPIEDRLDQVRAEHPSAKTFTDLYESVNNLKDGQK